jgi:polysaccharide export outer membrane protein
MEAIASVGGVTGRAALTRATLIRRSSGQTINVDLERLLLRGDRSANMALEPGDIVMVPMLQNRVLVLGGVRAPGALDLDDGARVIDALARAGGPAPGAAANNIGVIRNGSDGKAVVTHIDMNKIVKGDNAQNILVKDGDIVYVPEGPTVSWTNILFYLSGVGLIRGLLGR